MFDHTLELKFWDSRDKVCPKARFDRPKSFKFPLPKESEEDIIETVKKLLIHQEGTSHTQGLDQAAELFASGMSIERNNLQFVACIKF